MPYERHRAQRMHPHFYPGSHNRSISKTKQLIINRVALCPRSVTRRQQFMRGKGKKEADEVAVVGAMIERGFKAS